MFSYIQEFFRDPKGMLIFFLLAFPGRILALSLHEFGHAWVAHRCGDDTAKMMGRMTVNPLKHLDPLGTVLMLVVGFGWAKPVPVNPRNYRNYRKDDLKVSVAGVSMNLIMFCLGNLLMLAFLALAIARSKDDMTASYLPLLFQRYDYFNVAIYQVEQTFGEIAGYLFQMLYYFTVTNLVLCVFNLLPIPPLDGSHVLHNLLPNSPYSNPRVRQIAYFALLALMFSNIGSRVLGTLCNGAIEGVGSALYALIHLIGIA